jgi:hypothetical protein
MRTKRGAKPASPCLTHTECGNRYRARGIERGTIREEPLGCVAVDPVVASAQPGNRQRRGKDRRVETIGMRPGKTRAFSPS